MKVRKHYENGSVIVYVEDGGTSDCITFTSERQMRQLGICLTDLARISGNEVEIN